MFLINFTFLPEISEKMCLDRTILWRALGMRKLRDIYRGAAHFLNSKRQIHNLFYLTIGPVARKGRLGY